MLSDNPGNKSLHVLPATMQAMVMNVPGQPLINTTLPLPVPSAGQVLVKIIACGVLPYRPAYHR